MSQNSHNTQLKNQDLRELFDTLTQPMAILDNGIFVFYNSAFLNLLELNSENLPSYEHLFKESLPQFQETSFKKAINYQHSESEFSMLNVLFTRMKNSSVLITIETSTDPLYSLPSFGEFIGILSHQLSNPLAVLQANCDSFYLEAKNNRQQPKEEIIERCERLRKALERCRAYLGQLKELTLALKENPEEFLDKNLTTFWKEKFESF